MLTQQQQSQPVSRDGGGNVKEDQNMSDSPRMTDADDKFWSGTLRIKELWLNILVVSEERFVLRK